MKVIIEHFDKDSKDNIKYHEGKPITTFTSIKLPIEFGFGSYNEPKKIINHDINIEDIVAIIGNG